MSERQSCKIKEIGDALIRSGFLTLDEQARALGLSRSTTWTIRKANYKGSGLSAGLISRMLSAPQLPPMVRAILVEYVAEKSAGLHGHRKLQLRRFASRLSSSQRQHPQKSDQRIHNSSSMDLPTGAANPVPVAK